MDNSPYKIGKFYLVRTVTMAIAGRLVEIFDKELVFEAAAWIADTGRFHDGIKDPSKFSEVEPFLNEVIVGRESVVDATIIPETAFVQK